jgi:hypothetical protein
MELAIFNTDGSLMPVPNEIKLVWSSVLIADRIHYGGAYSEITYLQELFDSTKSDDAKVEMTIMYYPIMYKNLNVDISKYTKSLRGLYNEIKIARKTKGKSKDYLLKSMSAERTLKSIFQNVSTYLKDYRTNTTLEYLTPAFSFDDECMIKCYTEITLSFKKDKLKYLKEISDLIFKPDKYFLSDESVEKFQYENKDSLPEFLSIEFIDIPEFDYLIELQYTQFRDSFIPTTKDISEVFRSLKENVKDSEYSVENITHFLDVLKNSIDSYKEDFQSKLYENITMYTDIPASAKKHKLYAGITSVEKLISIYKNAKLFGDDFYAYLHEYLSQEHDLNKLIPFFYLKISK